MPVSTARRPAGTICTFYSYKGGVGRTFALANVATTISLWGYRVLCVDWDLEAPGLHLFFDSITTARADQGLVELIQAYGAGTHANWRECLVDATHPDAKGQLMIMPSGRFDDSYVRRMQELNWLELYEEADLGTRLEELRDEWKDEYDFILIDSRTGITDVGGICTVQLPDILVLVFTPNFQSVDGVVDVVRRAEAQRNRLPFDRARLTALPVVSRFEAGVKWAQEWLGIFEQRLDDIFGVWTNKSVSTAEMLNHTRIPYVADWSFGERLPVVEEGTRDPLTIGYAFETIAAMIAHRLESSELLASNRQSYVDSARREGLAGASATPGYEFDVLVSHGLGDRRRGLDLANHLARRGFSTWPPEGMSSSAEITIEQWQDAFRRCRNVVAMLSDRLTSWREEEYRQFVITALSGDSPRVLVPVLLSESPEAVPSFVGTQGWIAAVGRPLEAVADDIAERLWREAAAGGDAEAAYRLATLLGDRGDSSEAERLLRQASEAGQPAAALSLGLLLAARGDDSGAEIWLRQSARAGDADAILNLATVLERAGTVDEAEEYYRVAAEAGSLDAASNLASLLGTYGRNAEAEEWSSRRAEGLDAHLAKVAGILLDGDLLPVLGWGVNSVGSRAAGQTSHSPGPPLASELARRLAEVSKAPSDQDLPAVAQFASEVAGTRRVFYELHRMLTEDYSPTVVHQTLASLPAKFRSLGARIRPLVIATLNYDDALERAFDDAHEPYDVVTYLSEPRDRFLHCPFEDEPSVIRDPTTYLGLPIEERTIIVKLLGSVDRRGAGSDWESFVVTEDQFDDYLTRAPAWQLIPVQLMARLAESHPLFLDVAADDRNIRAVLKRVLSPPQRSFSWAVQPDASPGARQFWRSNGTDMIEVGLEHYIHALSAQVSEPRRRAT